jgi:hypothetical protein
MKVLKLNTPFEISVVPRIALVSSDELIFTARNEATGLSAEYTLFWSLINGRLNFELPDTNADFLAGNKYEIFITSNDVIIYRGKMIIVKEDTNIQNYTPSKQTTPRFL